MKALAVVNTSIFSEESIEFLPQISITGNKVSLGVVDIEEPAFEDKNLINDDLVLIKVDAFSCNYRDKAIIVKAALKMEKEGINGEPIEFFGSDFVGTVKKVGKNVKDISVGDRIIPNCYYPGVGKNEIIQGVTTNEASRGWLKLHHSKVIKIPSFMSDAVASAFSIGAQTSSSMIRKMQLKPDDRILVTSGRSNTSQFIIKNLLKKGHIPDVLTTSEWSEDELEFIFPSKLIKIDRGDYNWENYAEIEKYDAIFDPFFDLHILSAIKHLNMGGKYITCGYKNQHQSFQEETDKKDNDLNNIMLTAMINNTTIIGNCIGLTGDLSDAVIDYDKQNPPIIIDKIYSIDEGHKFLDKTYNTTRFGKAILSYT
ncbi:alcohol dehydrogenase catalytic domain-containing protein [Streptococcus dentapri]|uniref:Alcohol dehydrogenase catalytic domain-containing protein n=1 Tax=Streptococcus dentapri TaxID=573564 RepID=A0ABV8CZY9_9STRE